VPVETVLRLASLGLKPEGEGPTTFDLDFDGRFEHSVTEQYVRDAGVLHYILAQDFDGGGTLVVTEEGSASMAQDACGSGGKGTAPPPKGPACDQMANFPPWSPTDRSLGGGPIVVSSDCGPGATERLAAAYNCALGALDCISKSNPGLAEMVAAGLSSPSFSIRVGCSNGCQMASTLACPFGSPEPECQESWTNYRPADLGSSPDNLLCQVALHEMFHAIGFPFSPDHDNGCDDTYACARLCTGCRAGPQGTSPSYDCAVCASTPEAKRACGAKAVLAEGNCGVGVCHDGLACPVKGCETCRSHEELYCDGTPTGVLDFLCCAACPADCNKQVDFSCTGTEGERDNCGTPPQCQ
jgi:hypothetical protein